MNQLVERVLEALKRLRDPISGAPLLLLESVIEVRDLGDGVIHIVYTSRDPRSPNVITYAEAVKTLASRCEGVKKVIVEVRNHVMADFVNLKLNF